MVSDSAVQVVWLINTQNDYQSLLKYGNCNGTTAVQRFLETNAVKPFIDLSR